MRILNEYMACAALIGAMMTPAEALSRERHADVVEYLKGEAVLSEKTVYAGEPFIYSVYITTDNPNISKVYPLDAVTADALQVVTKLNPDRKIRRDEDGRYTVKVSAVMYASDSAGTFTIPESIYRVDYLVPATAYDPFWGYVRTEDVISRDVRIGQMKVKCKPLPKVPDGFSGAVGEFSIMCDTPDVYVPAGGEASVLYTVTGEGLLTDVEIPDFRMAIGEGLKLKSVSPQESTFLQRGKLISRITYECRVGASENGNYVIPGVAFTYFSPASGKYVTVQSDKCSVTTRSRNNPAVPKGQYVYYPASALLDIVDVTN